MQDRQIFIPTTTIVKIIAVLIGILVIWLVRDIVALVIVAVFLAALIQPAADWGSRYRIPRSLMVLFVYLVFFGLFAVAITLMVPTLIEQGTRVAELLGRQWGAIQDGMEWVKRITDQYGLISNLKSGLDSVQSQAAGAASRLFQALSDIFGGIAAFMLVLVMAFYLVTQENKATTLVQDWVSPKHRKFALRLIEELQDKMSRWFRGQLVLSLIIGAMYYIGLLIIGVDSALVLALFGGLTEFVPYLGPILGGIPIVFVAFSESPLRGALALGLIVLIQQLENNLIVPKVMQRSVGLNPLVSIVAMLVGLKLFGFMGALIAIPFATGLMVIIKEVRAYSMSTN